MAIARPDCLTITNAQAHGYDAARNAETMARKLREIADRLDEWAPALVRGDGKAVGYASQITNEYVQRSGSVGTFLASLIEHAGQADAEHAKADRP